MWLNKQNKKQKTKKKQQKNNPPGESKLQTVLLNKSSNVLKDYLFETLHAADAPDCLIAGTTLKLAKQTATALVG